MGNECVRCGNSDPKISLDEFHLMKRLVRNLFVQYVRINN